MNSSSGNLCVESFYRRKIVILSSSCYTSGNPPNDIIHVETHTSCPVFENLLSRPKKNLL